MCRSVVGTASKTEEDFDIPEDTQPSAEEEQQLQKKMGKEEFNLFSSHLFN